MKRFNHREKLLQELLKDKKRRPRVSIDRPIKEDDREGRSKDHIVQIGSIKCVFGRKSAEEIEEIMRRNRMEIEKRRQS